MFLEENNTLQYIPRHQNNQNFKFCQKVLFCHISFSLNHDKKQNEVNHLLFPVTMIVTKSFRPFPESKYQNLQKVLFCHCGIGNHRKLLYVD